jgi:hypothetical protein
MEKVWASHHGRRTSYTLKKVRIEEKNHIHSRRLESSTEVENDSEHIPCNRHCTLHIASILQERPHQFAKSTAKLHFTPADIKKRYKHARLFVESDGCFTDMMTNIHINEKWFDVRI